MFELLVIYTTTYRPEQFQNVIANTEIEVNLVQNYDTYFNTGINKINKNPKGEHVQNRYHVLKYMLDLYEESKNTFYDDLLMRKGNVADIVKSIIPKNAGSIYQSHLHVGDHFENTHLLIFEVPFSNDDETFLSAELRILTLVKLKYGSKLGVERVVHISFYDNIDKKIIKLEQKHVYHTNNTWISFNITSAVAHLLISHNPILKIVVTIQSFLHNADIMTGKFEISLLPLKTNDLEHDYPLLLLSYTAKGNDLNLFSRMKRFVRTDNITQKPFGRMVDQIDTSEKLGTNENAQIDLVNVYSDYVANGSQYNEIVLNYDINKHKENTSVRITRSIDIEDYEEESNNVWDDDSNGISRAAARKHKRLRNSCRKKSLYVNFSEISYDSWIVQPSGYEANQCIGKCFYPIAEHLSPTKHAIVQSLVHNVSPRRVNRASCVPTRLGSISILYVDIRGVLTYRLSYPDMVVLECGCR